MIDVHTTRYFHKTQLALVILFKILDHLWRHILSSYMEPFRVKSPVNLSSTCNNTQFYEQKALRPQRSLQEYQIFYIDVLSEGLIFAY